MLEASLRIRTHLHFGEQCCTDFIVTESMLAKCNSEVMCSTSNKDEEDGSLLTMKVYMNLQNTYGRYILKNQPSKP